MPHARQQVALLLRAFSVGLLLAGCAGSNGAAEPDAGAEAPTLESEPSMTIEQVLEQRTPELMRLPGVVGVGQGVCDAAPCIRVYITADSVAATLPQRLDGYLVDPAVTGQIRSRE